MKRVFTVLACVAFANLATLAGVTLYAFAHHGVTAERLRKAVAILRGEPESHAEPTTRPAEPVIVAVEKPKPADGAETNDVVRTELERRRREIEDGWRLLETQQLALVRDRETFEAETRRRQAAVQEAAEKAGDSGYKKELEVLGGLKAKQAKDLLKQKKDADVAAILLKLEDRKVRQIVGECKTNEERLWIGRILDQLHQRDATQAEVLSARQ